VLQFNPLTRTRRSCSESATEIQPHPSASELPLNFRVLATASFREQGQGKVKTNARTQVTRGMAGVEACHSYRNDEREDCAKVRSHQHDAFSGTLLELDGFC
jgi:hypothetical protein